MSSSAAQSSAAPSDVISSSASEASVSPSASQSSEASVSASVSASAEPSASASASAEPSASASASVSASASAEPSASASAGPSASASQSQGSSAGVSASASGASASSASASASTSGPSSGAESSSGANQASASQQVSTVYSTIISTGANGELTTQTSAVGTVTQAPSSNGGSSTNVGAIAGGVVGGVVGLALIATLLWFFCIKKRKNHRDDFDDMMFDPSRAQNHAPVDLADNGAPTVDPYPYGGPGVASTATSPQMQQYNTAPPTAFSGSSESGYPAQPGVHRGPSSAASSAGFAGRGANMHPSEGYGYASGAAGAGAAAPMMAAAAPNNNQNNMTAKQREAFQHSQNRMRVHNEGPSGSAGYGAQPMSPTDTTTSGDGVTVHQDGGEYDDAPELGKEVPPTYDSIPRK